MDDNENPNVKFGKALEQYDETNLPSKHSNVPVFEQVVTDEEGRRRFHGAFTGGFSAGYYNTVGSKDGWQPSTFKSSRKNKKENARNQYRPEDFMDEEDMGDFGIAPKTIMTKNDFSSNQRKRNYNEEKMVKEHERTSTLFLGPELLNSLVVPAKSNIGIRLLKKLGWKEGQGVGDRVKGKKPLSQFEIIKRKYTEDSQILTQTKENDSDDDPRTYEEVTFAPKDTLQVPLKPKDNLFGVGYRGMDPTKALRGNKEKSVAIRVSTESGKKMSFKGHAFGVGAFEEDDDDIYAVDTMDNYDVITGSSKEKNDDFGWTRPQQAIQGYEARPAISDRASNEVKGFVAGVKQKLLSRKVYPAPMLPKNFDPNRRLKLNRAKMRIENKLKQPTVENEDDKYKQLDADDRRMMLDSEAPTGGNKIKSVFDLMSYEDRMRLKAFKNKLPGNEENVAREDSVVREPSPAREVVEIKKPDPTKPLCDLSKLKPFASDPAKQRRYEEFERSIRQRNKDPYRGIVSSLTEWERNQEKQEFSKIAQFHLKIFDKIGDKFVKASHGDNELKENKVEVKKKVFGPETHKSQEWHPDPLLCRRFNVPDPYPDSDMVGTEETSIFSNLKAIEAEAVKNMNENISKYNEEESEKQNEINEMISSIRNSQSNTDATNKEEDKNESSDSESEAEPPSMDLFKSIFAADSDSDVITSSDEDDDDVTKEKQETEKAEEIKPKHVFKKPQPEESPPPKKHVFKKPSDNSLDEPPNERPKHVFKKPTDSNDETSDEKPKHVFKKPTKSDDKPNDEEKESSPLPGPSLSEMETVEEKGSPEIGPPLSEKLDEDDSYMPTLPPTLGRPSFLKTFSASSSSDSEVEFVEKKVKKHKKKKKHKHKKEKKKKKHKKNK